MSDRPPNPEHREHPELITRNARYGLLLFAIYLPIYAAFVVLGAFAPGLMAKPVLAGVNLAIVSGFGLIVLAMLLAIIYMLVCGRAHDSDRNGGEQ